MKELKYSIILYGNKETDKFKSIKNRLQTIGIDDGFSSLKECVENFILNMRYYQLKNKYEIEANKFRSVTDKVYTIGIHKIPINISEAELRERALDEKKKRLDPWWATTWKEIFERFEIFFQTKIYLKTNPDNIGTRNKFFDDFREKYIEMIDHLFEKVESMKLSRQKVIYQRVGRGQGNVSSNEAHIEIRKELSQQVYKAIHEIPPILSRIMFEGISEILDWISLELWGIKEITEEIINDGPQSNTIMLKERIEALILRFARPAIDLFLSYPRYDNRRKTMSLYKQEICILDMYYFDEESKSFKIKGLKNFLACGAFSNENSDILNFDTSKLNFSVMTENIEDTLREIDDDIRQFSNYMKNSIYYASGLESFFKQELDKIALMFEIKEKNERLWQTYVIREIEKGNENIPFEKIDTFIEKQKLLREKLNKIKDFHLKSRFHFVSPSLESSLVYNDDML